jgi:hypothetical protein
MVKQLRRENKSWSVSDLVFNNYAAASFSTCFNKELAKSKRPKFITLFQTATKLCTKFLENLHLRKLQQ